MSWDSEWARGRGDEPARPGQSDNTSRKLVKSTPSLAWADRLARTFGMTLAAMLWEVERGPNEP